MTQASNADLWKQAYRTQFATDPDQDMTERADDVEQWRINWQSGYDADEDWARNMLNTGTGSEQLGAQQPDQDNTPGMRTFADMARVNANIRQQYDTWRNDVALRGEDSTDWDAFRSWLTTQGLPDPGGRPPDDFVGDDWKAQHPEWVARFGDRAA